MENPFKKTAPKPQEMKTELEAEKRALELGFRRNDKVTISRSPESKQVVLGPDGKPDWSKNIGQPETDWIILRFGWTKEGKPAVVVGKLDLASERLFEKKVDLYSLEEWNERGPVYKAE